MRTVLIDNYPVHIKANSLTVVDSLGQRTTANFDVVVSEQQTDFPGLQVGDPVLITQDATVIFAGMIETFTEAENDPGKIDYHVTASDFNRLADRRCINLTGKNRLAGDLVRDIITQCLASEGIKDKITVSEEIPYRLITNGITASAGITTSGDPQNVIDGNTNTYWKYIRKTSHDPGTYLKIDFGQVKKISKVETFRVYSAFSIGIPLYYSIDGTTWEVATNNLAVSSGSTFKVTTFSTPITARYLKIDFEVNESYLGDAYVYELKFYEYVPPIYIQTIQDGPLIEEYAFSYNTCTDALNKIKELTGYEWNIDFNKVMHFFDRATYRAPFTLSDNIPHSNFRKQLSHTNYRNRQLVLSAMCKTDPIIEEVPSPVPDGYSRTFTLRYKIESISKAEIDRNIGLGWEQVSAEATGKGGNPYFSYNVGDNTITQYSQEAVLMPGAKIRISYTGLQPKLTQQELDDQIAIRREEETGTSGIYEHVIVDDKITSSQASTSLANALLAKYGELPCTVTFNTEVPGLKAGQLLTIVKPLFNITDAFLIDQVRLKGQRDGTIQYEIRALDGAAVGGWEEFFRRLAQRNQPFVITDNLVVNFVTSPSDTSAFTSSTLIQVLRTLYPNNTLYPSDTLYPGGDEALEVEIND